MSLSSNNKSSNVLLLVREEWKAHGKINSDNKGGFVFQTQQLTLPEQTKTAFKRTLKADDYFYSLKDVIFFLEHNNNNNSTGVGNYRRLCNELKITAVVEPDKPNLRDYVNGTIDTCPQLQQQQQTSSSKSQSKQASALSSSSSTAATTTTTTTGLVGGKRQFEAGRNSDVLTLDASTLQMDKEHLKQRRIGEIPAQTRITVLAKPGLDFAFALKLFNEHILKPKTTTTATTTATTPLTPGGTTTTGALSALTPNNNNNNSNNGGRLTATAYDYNRPIIIVPAALTTILNINNIKPLLEKHVFVPSNQIDHNKMENNHVVYVTRDLSTTTGGGGRTTTTTTGNVPTFQTYKVIDNVSQLTMDDWRGRVVAVVVDGPLWQFKDWPWTTNNSNNNNNNASGGATTTGAISTTELFQQMAAIHVALEGRTLPSNIGNWNCSVLKLHEFKRHGDGGVVNEFWRIIDSFVHINKPWLQQQHNNIDFVSNNTLANKKPPASFISTATTASSSSKQTERHGREIKV